jgi:hypothetical protein
MFMLSFIILDVGHLAATVNCVPPEMTQCMSSFLEMCYIFRRNAITTSVFDLAQEYLKRFHILRNIFVEAEVRANCSLPRQHAFVHFGKRTSGKPENPFVLSQGVQLLILSPHCVWGCST